MDLKIVKVMNEINSCDEVMCSYSTVVDMLVGKQKEASTSFWRNIHFMESMLKQKIRMTWLKEGDFKTIFSHFFEG